MAKKYASLTTLQNLVDNIKTLFVKKTDLETTLSGYDTKGSAAAVQENLNVISDTLNSHASNADIHVTTANKTNWNAAYTHSTSTHARTDATNVSDSTTNGNIKINGTETNVYSHPNSGVVAGTYKRVTVNAQGHVTAGSNPTTLSGFGITDGEIKSDARAKLTEAKTYTDTVASTKADSNHNHNDLYDTKSAVNTKIDTHNTSTTAHNDIRLLISGLTTRLNTLADSDDTTLDQLSEIVTYIKNNKSLIDGITTNKVNVADIIDNLTTNVTSKPLSAAQGVAIQKLIDDLQEELDSHTHTVSEITDLTATATELNYMDGVTSNVQTQLDNKAASSHNHSASNITSGILAIERGGTGNMWGYVQAGALEDSSIGALATAEGRNTTASGDYSHAEGNYTEATGSSAHAEGQNTTASGTASHAEGENTTASGNYSHAEGENTIASSKHQHVQGKFNKEDSSGTYAHIVGNGTGASSSSRSNAHTVDWDGNGWFAGNVYVGGTSQSEGSPLVKESDLNWNLIYDSGEISAIANSIAGINVSGYTKFRVVVRCYNDGDSYGDRTGSAIFKAQNGKSYQFPVWTNMFSKSISTVSAMADFELTDDWLVCPNASRLVGEIDIFDTAEGGTAGNLISTGSGILKCTSPLSTLTISNLDQNSKYYFGIYSRVMVWGCKA